jgi:ABC-2 type transport system permease protein
VRPLHTLRAFPSLVRIGFAEMVVYRAEVVIWILTATMPLIMLAVWDRVVEQGAIGQFGAMELTGYFTVTLVARQLTSAWVVWELNDDIRTGALNAALLKPMHPLMLRAAENLATVPFRLAVLAPIVGLLALWRPEMAVALDPGSVALFLGSVVLAWALTFLVQAIFGCFAFWVDQSMGAFNVWFGLWALFSGYLAPVELMPRWLAVAATWLPFRSMLGVPVEIGTGLLRGEGLATALAVQALWVVVAWTLLSALWSRGLRRYGAFGA